MSKNSFLIILILISISACKRNRLVDVGTDKIEFSPLNDTISMERFYSNGRRKERINFENNHRNDNILYDKTGRPFTKPTFFVDTNSQTKENTLVILLPVNQYKKYSIYFNGEGSNASDSLTGIVVSSDIPLKPGYVNNNSVHAVIGGVKSDGGMDWFVN